MGFIKRVKFVDSATGMEVGNENNKQQPPRESPMSKFRNKRIYCNRGHRVKITGKHKEMTTKDDIKFKCQTCGILNENQVSIIG